MKSNGLSSPPKIITTIKLLSRSNYHIQTTKRAMFLSIHTISTYPNQFIHTTRRREVKVRTNESNECYCECQQNTHADESDETISAQSLQRYPHSTPDEHF